jgi:hypothetical protein
MHFLAERFFFSCDDWGILKEVVKTYLRAQSPPPNLTVFCFFICTSVAYASTEALSQMTVDAEPWNPKSASGTQIVTSFASSTTFVTLSNSNRWLQLWKCNVSLDVAQEHVAIVLPEPYHGLDAELDGIVWMSSGIYPATPLMLYRDRYPVIGVYHPEYKIYFGSVFFGATPPGVPLVSVQLDKTRPLPTVPKEILGEEVVELDVVKVSKNKYRNIQGFTSIQRKEKYCFDYTLLVYFLSLFFQQLISLLGGFGSIDWSWTVIT